MLLRFSIWQYGSMLHNLYNMAVGDMALWHYGTTVLWHYGDTAIQRYSDMAMPL